MSSDESIDSRYEPLFDYFGRETGRAIMAGDASGQESDAYAAVELEDGTLLDTPIAQVRLLDSKKKFSQYYWGDADD